MRSSHVFQCMLVLLAVGAVLGSSVQPVRHDMLTDMLGTIMGMGSSLMGAGSDAAGSAASAGSGMMDMFGGLGGIIRQIISSWASVIKGILDVGGEFVSKLLNLFGAGFLILNDIVDNLSDMGKVQINRMVRSTSQTFTSTMKSNLKPEKNQLKLKREILAVQKIMESKHSHKEALVKELKSKAPSLSSAVQTAYNHATKEFQKHTKAFRPETKKAVQKMHAVVNKAGLDFSDILEKIPGKLKEQGAVGSALARGFNLMTNMLHGLTIILPK